MDWPRVFLRGARRSGAADSAVDVLRPALRRDDLPAHQRRVRARAADVGPRRLAARGGHRRPRAVRRSRRDDRSHHRRRVDSERRHACVLMASRMLYALGRDGLGVPATTGVNAARVPRRRAGGDRRGDARLSRDRDVRDDHRDRGVLLRRRLRAVLPRRVRVAAAGAQRRATVSRDRASVEHRLRAGRLGRVPGQRGGRGPAEQPLGARDRSRELSRLPPQSSASEAGRAEVPPASADPYVSGEQ